jgi:hypothetical protein
VTKPFYELSSRPGQERLASVRLPRSQRQVRGTNLRRSQRWLDSYPAVSGEYQLPHIDWLGRFTGESVYTLACSPADVLSTTVSTIYGRLKRYAYAHNEREVVNKRRRDLLRASAYYALTKNSYYMDRVLYFLRNLRKNSSLIHRVTLKFLMGCDADKRFVYGQVCFQTNWLIFRAAKPRDKSHQKFKSPTDLAPEGGRVKRSKNVRSLTTRSAEDVAMIGRLDG